MGRDRSPSYSCWIHGCSWSTLRISRPPGFADPTFFVIPRNLPAVQVKAIRIGLAERAEQDVPHSRLFWMRAGSRSDPNNCRVAHSSRVWLEWGTFEPSSEPSSRTLSSLFISSEAGEATRPSLCHPERSRGICCAPLPLHPSGHRPGSDRRRNPSRSAWFPGFSVGHNWTAKLPKQANTSPRQPKW